MEIDLTNQEDLMIALINKVSSGCPERIWCPGCDNPRIKTEGVGPWMLDPETLVCIFGVCGSCAELLIDPERSEGQLKRIKAALLARYPKIWTVLGPDYSLDLPQPFQHKMVDSHEEIIQGTLDVDLMAGSQ